MEGDLILSDLQQSALPSPGSSRVLATTTLVPQGVPFPSSRSFPSSKPFPNSRPWRDAAIGATGYLWGLGAAAIWSGWWTVTRVGVVNDLPVTDLAELRFGISGILLLPLAWRQRHAIRAVPLQLLLLMAAGAGAPYVLVTGTGVRLTSAGLGGAITVGLLPAFTLILSILFLSEKVTRRLAVGVGCILLGATLVTTGTWQVGRVGDGVALFATGALLWAGYTVALKRSGMPPLAATAVICVASLALYTPIWLGLSGPTRLLAASSGELLLQIFYQSLLSAIAALYCYGRAIGLLGAPRASVFAAIVPLFSVIIAAAVLHESPSLLELGGAALLAAGALAAARRSPAGAERRRPSRTATSSDRMAVNSGGLQ